MAGEFFNWLASKSDQGSEHKAAKSAGHNHAHDKHDHEEHDHDDHTHSNDKSHKHVEKDPFADYRLMGQKSQDDLLPAATEKPGKRSCGSTEVVKLGPEVSDIKALLLKGKEKGFHFDASGQLKSMTLIDETANSNIEFDEQGSPKSITSKFQSGSERRLEFEKGKLTKATYKVRQGGQDKDEVTEFDFNEFGRTTMNGREAYGTIKMSLSPGVEEALTIDPNHKLKSINLHSIYSETKTDFDEGRVRSLQYTAEGSTRKSLIFEWDGPLKELVTITKEGHVDLMHNFENGKPTDKRPPARCKP